MSAAQKGETREALERWLGEPLSGSLAD